MQDCEKNNIRPATRADLDIIFEMLTALVIHEGLQARFQMTRIRLETELFGENADWNCLVATDGSDLPIGLCLYTFANISRAFNTTAMIQIDDLYVDPAWRKKGVGEELVTALARIAKGRKIGRMNVLCVRDNLQGQNFYQKIGAEKRDFVDLYSIPVQKIIENAKP